MEMQNKSLRNKKVSCFFKLLATISIATTSTLSYGYEIESHSYLTNESYKRSILSSPALLENLDLKIYEDSPQWPLGMIYLDVQKGIAKARWANGFEGLIMQEVSNPLGIQWWLLSGSIREDDLSDELRILMPRDHRDPGDDPYGNITRVFNHFYDPYHNTGLDIIFDNEKAIDWALGTKDIFNSPIQNENRRNHFSLHDAYESMYRALTGYSTDGTLLPLTLNAVSTDAESLRKAYWATTFKSLGHVMHILQDMAQPQHTRNDPHTPTHNKERTYYEAYVNARVTQQRFFDAMSGEEKNYPPLPNSRIMEASFHPAVTGQFIDFFSTTASTELLNGQGLADYSNRNFFTHGTNLLSESNSYIYPPNDPIDPSYKDVSEIVRIADKEYMMWHLQRAVEGFITGEDKDTAIVTTRSLFDSMWPEYVTGIASYTMSEQVYADQARLLTARAIAYGRSLLDYFFRGHQIEVVVEPTFIKIINHMKSTANSNITAPLSGTFELLYDDDQGNRQKIPGGTWSFDSNNTENFLYLATAELDLPFLKASTNSDKPYSDSYVLVFHGKAHNERLVMGWKIDLKTNYWANAGDKLWYVKAVDGDIHESWPGNAHNNWSIISTGNVIQDATQACRRNFLHSFFGFNVDYNSLPNPESLLPGITFPAIVSEAINQPYPENQVLPHNMVHAFYQRNNGHLQLHLFDDGICPDFSDYRKEPRIGDCYTTADNLMWGYCQYKGENFEWRDDFLLYRWE